MPFSPVPETLLDFIKKHDTFFIIGHVEPDGDCIGSQIALKHFLERKGKKAKLFSPGPFGRKEVVRFRGMFEERIGGKDLDTDAGVILLDCSMLERIGTLAEDVAGMETAVIDHHSSGEADVGTVRYIEPKAPCVTLLVQKLIETMGEEPDAEEAYFLFFGFSTDTGYFRHLEAEAEEALAMVARLAGKGISPRTIYRDTYGTYSLESRIFIADALKTAETFFDGRLIIVHEMLDHAARFGGESRQPDTVYQLLLSVDGCKALAFIREEERGRTSVSLRSSDNVDVGAVSRIFGGGGHRNAAGFTTPLSFAAVKPLILERFAEIFGGPAV